MAFDFNGNIPENVKYNNDYVKRIKYNNEVVWEKILPVEYQEVEYLECDGTQYINTGVAYANDLFIEDIILYTDLDVPLGASYRTNGVSATVYWGLVKPRNETKWYWVAGSDNPTPYYPIVNQKYKVNVDTLEKKVYVDDVLIGERPTSATGTGNIYLFAIKKATGSEVGIFDKQTRRYGTKIYKNGTFVRDLIPCRRKADNKPGMYDIVNSRFYVNAGAGEFSVGPDI